MDRIDVLRCPPPAETKLTQTSLFSSHCFFPFFFSPPLLFFSSFFLSFSLPLHLLLPFHPSPSSFPSVPLLPSLFSLSSFSSSTPFSLPRQSPSVFFSTVSPLRPPLCPSYLSPHTHHGPPSASFPPPFYSFVRGKSFVRSLLVFFICPWALPSGLS
ncbi:hypothetical protein ASPWEDRAFT_350776 [Aspergillus wentii DTO 134E9]|uniref:Uncharacterized protein n=1 Tax=Aspergillus wentii DTO 134E9 TaxID=1073089 RepID=A0A1L9RVP6_ASPWE|nr:uncharacterized protein ASPWEDRAFT_350776 [Aspergillus wentii DTO 134E9]OJJ38999.1 hypothetical protein ASPWEDRAFT_350776 [Aspergillus wentii DTO 134E9]